jgi:protein-L-isoaspartate O-methyltransferase
MAATMLHLLDVRPGHRVLEAIADAAYNAGSISPRSGGQVVTVDSRGRR